MNYKYFWKNSDFYGRANLLFRYAAYIFNAIFLLIFLEKENVEFNIWHGFSFILIIVLPYFIFVYYVNRDNDKGVGIRQNMIDFLFVGWFTGLIHLLLIPSFIFVLGTVTNYIASRGFHKFYRILLLPLGYFLVILVYGFEFAESMPDVLLYLALSYGLIHFISLSYISYNFSKNVQIINAKVINQQKEILTQSEELQALNDSLKSLNNHLEDKVVERTKELQLKNEKLAEYTFINGHQLRAPVATMLGLCNLLDYSKELRDKEEIISKLKDEVKLLDITIKEIRLKLETDQTINDKVKEVETEHSHFEKLKDRIQ